MEFLEGHTVGIDLGTTFSSLAYFNPQGEPEALKNADGKTMTPSVVLLSESGQVVVGPSFERMAVEDPANIIEAIKRQMGNKDFHVIYQGKKLTPEFISALILKKLKQDAETQIGPIANAVVTVPYYFNDVRRKATQDAGRIAGLNVIDIINEPTAATLAYAWIKGELGRPDKNTGERTILVYDLGGGTFDVTVVRYTASAFRVLATDGDVLLGGLDWTRRIVDHVSEQFQRKYGDDPRDDPETLLQFQVEAEDAKRKLSSTTQVPVTCYYKGNTLSVSLTRTDFERMTSDLMQRTRDTTELVLQQAGIQPGQLDDVVMVGGSTHMPIVETTLTKVCGIKPSKSISAEEAVAMGAGIHAAILEARARGTGTTLGQAVINRLRSIQTADVNSHSLGVKITDPQNRTEKINHIMIPRNTQIPFSYSQRFVTNSPNQQTIHVNILEGETRDPDGCTLIGDFRIVNLPGNLPAGSPVEITYSYLANGRIAATARELTGNREASTEIVRDSGTSSSQVDAFRVLADNYVVE